MRPVSVVLAAVVTFATSPLHPLGAQTTIDARGASIVVGGRLHTQFQASSVDGAASDVFLRRARIMVDVTLNDFVDARVQPDFAGDASLKDAWVRFAFSDAFQLSFGQFKRAGTVFELSSSTDLPVVERDGRIGGLDVCSGVGRVCSLSRLTEGLGFDGRDLGLRAAGDLGSGFSYLATFTNGEGSNASDVNDGKSVAGRVEFAGDGATVGAFAATRDHVVTVADEEDTEFAAAGGVDVEVGTWRDGLHLLGAVVAGDNWRAGSGVGFTTFQLLGSYYVPTEGRITGVEPLLRVSWADPDTDVDDDDGLLVTPGVMAYFTGKNGISLNLDVYSPAGEGDTEVSFKLQSFLYF